MRMYEHLVSIVYAAMHRERRRAQRELMATRELYEINSISSLCFQVSARLARAEIPLPSGLRAAKRSFFLDFLGRSDGENPPPR